MLSYQVRQQQLALYLRNPESNPAPEGISQRRLTIYRELFFNNIESFIANGFPVFKSLCDESRWQQLIRTFFNEHRCETPYFLKITEEFLLFLEQNPHYILAWPYALELCHYEWLELELDTLNEPTPDFDAKGDVLKQSLQLSPWLRIGVYQWPVHQIGPDAIPDKPSPQPNCLLVYRNQELAVEFLQSNPATLHLLALLGEQQLALPEALEQLAPQLGQEVSAIESFAKQTVQQFHQLGIILGATKQ